MTTNIYTPAPKRSRLSLNIAVALAGMGDLTDEQILDAVPIYTTDAQYLDAIRALLARQAAVHATRVAELEPIATRALERETQAVQDAEAEVARLSALGLAIEDARDALAATVNRVRALADASEETGTPLTHDDLRAALDGDS